MIIPWEVRLWVFDGSGGDLPRGGRGPDNLKPRIGSTVQAQVRERAGLRIQDGGAEGASLSIPKSSWCAKTSARGDRRHCLSGKPRIKS